MPDRWPRVRKNLQGKLHPVDTPRIWILDDGELGQVRAVLHELRLDFTHRETSEQVDALSVPPEVGILFATPRAAVRLEGRRPAGSSTWIAVAHGESKTQRVMLRKAGFDFVVPDEVHPAALRQLILRSFFQGKERQASPRVAVGMPVTLRAGLHWCRGVLVDVSLTGCRLLIGRWLPVGSRVSVRMRTGPGWAGRLRLAGSVARSALGSAEGGGSDHTIVGIEFDPLSFTKLRRLEAFVRARQVGPAVFPSAETPPERRRTAAPAAPEAADVDRRRLPRVLFEREVEAMCAGATRALLGRDLSEHGIRVESDVRVAVGERLRLAIYGLQEEEPLFAEARVLRDDGSRGLMLRFDWMESETRDRLIALIGTLSPIHSLRDDTVVHAVEVQMDAGEPAASPEVSRPSAAPTKPR